MKIRWLILFCFSLSSVTSYSQDSSLIKVQFIYGSRPLKKHKDTEKKWFGGVLGGHVGIEGYSGEFYSFEKSGKNKIFNGKKNNSVYKIATEKEFWSVMKTKEDSLKTATVIVPVSQHQKQKLDSITSVYSKEVPYCYAVFGMRCGASTYEILAQIGLLPQYSHFKTCLKIFYPRQLRKRLLAKAEANSWTVIKAQGTPKRKWERDVKFRVQS
ncbi:MAG TPA: hypothetical protein VL095_05845 [Flavisolibacter sp.]|nr:hypothetical protein [Flavisolibacter sp.]